MITLWRCACAHWNASGSACDACGKPEKVPMLPKVNYSVSPEAAMMLGLFAGTALTALAIGVAIGAQTVTTKPTGRRDDTPRR